MGTYRSQLSTGGKIFSFALLTVFTVLPIVYIIALWPNELPPAGKGAYYQFKWFNMRWSDSTGDIHLNSIMFTLVALSGFLGAMIHLGTSFTNYVGAGKFKKSWVLWYCVKPFTAAAVAMVFYMVLQAGLLNYNGGGGVNPFGVVILAALAGLFTDKATLKLEEIFTIIFKPKDIRPGKLDEGKVVIERADTMVALSGMNKLCIQGKGFSGKELKVLIQNEEVSDVVITDGSVTINYQVPDALKELKQLSLVLLDGAKNKVYEVSLEVVPEFTEEMRRALDTRLGEEDTDDATEADAVATDEETSFVKG